MLGSCCLGRPGSLASRLPAPLLDMLAVALPAATAAAAETLDRCLTVALGCGVTVTQGTRARTGVGSAYLMIYGDAEPASDASSQES